MKFKQIILFSILFISLFGFCQSDHPKFLLITGCGISGTTYIAEFLKKNGLDINHERIGNDGCVSWSMLANYFSPWGPIANEEYIHIFHQVRHPLDVITSWFINLSCLERDEWVFIRQHIPEIEESDSLIVQCAKYWYYWNLKAEKISEWRYQIEQINDMIPEFENRIMRQLETSLLETIPTNTNNWANTKHKLTWRTLKRHLPADLYVNLREMALRYGYVE